MHYRSLTPRVQSFAVGGMMVFIVCHELLPSAHRYMGDTNQATAWFMLGMVVMATSLVLFNF